jgi:hypothetical protein
MSERAAEEFKHIMEELVPLARSYKLTIGLESGRSQGTFCTPQAVTKLVREIGREELTVVPDFEAAGLKTCNPFAFSISARRSRARKVTWRPPLPAVHQNSHRCFQLRR